MKTALTKFIEYLEGIQERDKIPSWVITTAKNYLQSEKQQIIDARLSEGLYKTMKVGEQALYLAQLKGMPYEEAKISAEQYYKETYGHICEACNGTGLVDGDCIEDKESCFNCLGRGK